MRHAILLLAVLGLAGCRSSPEKPEAESMPVETTPLDEMIARFAPVDIGADVSHLPDGERRALTKMIEAARLMDGLFLDQVWSGNTTMLMNLVADETPLGRARLHYFLINKGPWSRPDHNEPFVPGAPPKPGGANFYPADASKEEIERWMAKLSPAERANASGFFTTVRRGPNGFVVVPYAVEYEGVLADAAARLREAAALTTQPTLKAFLEARSAAFRSNDYYASDVAWMELDATIEPTIGPYEVYEDEWFNAKASFEAYITLRDQAETEKLTRFSGELQELEDHLPVDPKYRNPKLGALAPISVVNEVFASGDGNRAVQTAAYNLPNDERVVREKGTKRVMLKNVQEAKFKVALVPISGVVLAQADRADVSFDAFFTHILMHELMHGLGPHQITVNGRATTVRQELKDTYSVIEEAKADISGLWALQYLVDKGALDRSFERTMYKTFLASAFRSIRFGINEAHGRGIAIQINWLLDRGAFRVNHDGTFAVNEALIKQAVADLTREFLTLQAEGSYTSARGMLDGLGVVRPEVQTLLTRLRGIPVDIEPDFTTARMLLEEGRK